MTKTSVHTWKRVPTVKETFAAIRELGLTVNRRDGEWRVNYRDGTEATANYTTDNLDALGTARAMVAHRHHLRTPEQHDAHVDTWFKYVMGGFFGLNYRNQGV